MRFQIARITYFAQKFGVGKLLLKASLMLTKAAFIWSKIQ